MLACKCAEKSKHSFHNDQYARSVFHEGWRVWLMFWRRLSQSPTCWEGRIKAKASEGGWILKFTPLTRSRYQNVYFDWGPTSKWSVPLWLCLLSGCDRGQIKMCMPAIGWSLMILLFGFEGEKTSIEGNVFGVHPHWLLYCTLHKIRHVCRQKLRGVWGFQENWQRAPAVWNKTPFVALGVCIYKYLILLFHTALLFEAGVWDLQKERKRALL